MKILFYNDTAFSLSETFILNQAKSDYNFERVILYNENINLDNALSKEHQSLKIDLTPVNNSDRLLSLINRTLNRTSVYTFPYSTQRKIESIIKEYNISAIHCNYGQNAIKFMSIAQKTNTPLICHFHGYDSSQLLASKKYRTLLKKTLKLSFASITVSNNMTSRLIKYGLDLNKNYQIPYGTDVKKIDTIKKSRNSDNKITILHAGRLTEKKGVPDLIKVFSNLIDNQIEQNLELLIIGSGEEEETVKRLINEYNIGNKVKLLGAKPHDVVINSMINADIFVLNSRIAKNGDMEGYPNTIIEAMASECAVVSTYHAGIPDAIDHEINGILVNEYDNEALEDAISKLISDSSLRKKIGKAAKNKALSTFSIELMQEKYYQIYKSALDSKF